MNSIYSSSISSPRTSVEDAYLVKADNSLKATEPSTALYQTLWERFSTLPEENNSQRPPQEIQSRWKTHLSKFIIPLNDPRHEQIIKELAPYVDKTKNGEVDWDCFSQVIASQNLGYYYSAKDLNDHCKNLKSSSSSSLATFPSEEEKKNYIQSQVSSFRLWEKNCNQLNSQRKTRKAAKRALSPDLPSSEKRFKPSKWSATEDAWLLSAISLNRASHEKALSWSKVASEAQKISGGSFNRESKQCRERYIEHLRPNTIKKVNLVNQSIIMELCALFYNHETNSLPAAILANEINSKKPNQPQYTDLAIKNFFHRHKRSLTTDSVFPLCPLDPTEKQERINSLISRLSYKTAEKNTDTSSFAGSNTSHQITSSSANPRAPTPPTQLTEDGFIWETEEEDFGLSLDVDDCECYELNH